MPNQIKRNFAFISYNHKDVNWAKWLRRRLEWYRLPAEIHNEFDDSRYIRPVFRDRDELNSGILNDELHSRLEASRYLIVICSPNAAKSKWVSDEVKAFIEMGRLEFVIPFIVNGEPQNYANSDITVNIPDECFPLAIRQWNKENPDHNLLAINIFDDGKKDVHKALVRLISRMLGVQFDTLWQRHKRAIRNVAVLLGSIFTVLILLAYWFIIPIHISVTLNDEKTSLPEMGHGILYVRDVAYGITNPDTTVVVQSFPGGYRLRTIPVRFVAERFYDIEENNIKLTAGGVQDISISLHRDQSFAVFKFI